jgi:hypothetical protein
MSFFLGNVEKIFLFIFRFIQYVSEKFWEGWRNLLFRDDVIENISFLIVNPINLARLVGLMGDLTKGVSNIQGGSGLDGGGSACHINRSSSPQSVQIILCFQAYDYINKIHRSDENPQAGL